MHLFWIFAVPTVFVDLDLLFGIADTVVSAHRGHGEQDMHEMTPLLLTLLVLEMMSLVLTLFGLEILTLVLVLLLTLLVL